jgi:hypothetical protein
MFPGLGRRHDTESIVRITFNLALNTKYRRTLRVNRLSNLIALGLNLCENIIDLQNITAHLA